MNIQEMIQSGAFGTNQPSTGYNPYAQMSQPMMQQQPMGYGNMIPVGSYNYNSSTFQQQQPQQNNGYVFSPAVPNFTNPYAPRQDYYNPYPQYNNQQSAIQQYSYQNYGGYIPFVNSPFMSMQKRQELMQAQVDVNKLRCKIAMGITGSEYNDDKIDAMFNPNNQANVKTPEQIDADREWAYMNRVLYFVQNPSPVDYPERHLANFMQLELKNYHEAFDNRSMCEFFEEDAPKLWREFWIAENIKKNANRDLSSVYSSSDYNDLLRMHNSSNPYINQLLDNARYDNNIGDMELGLAEIFNQEKRRRNVLQDKLPTYISSPEVQEQRRKFTSLLLDQLYHKEARKANEQGIGTGATQSSS